MADYDIVVVGSGPAGLSAGRHLARSGYRTLILERDVFGGNLQHAARIDDYAAHPDGIAGVQLAAELLEQATAAGASLEQAEVSGLELFSQSRWVACVDGRGFACRAVILAAGTRFESLGLPNEQRLRGRGVIDCTPCDGGFFVGQPVAIYGSTAYAAQDAAYLANVGARVTLIAPDNGVQHLPGIETRGGLQLAGIVGDDHLEGIICKDAATQVEEQLAVRGLAIRVGSVPNTEGVADTLDCDQPRYLVTTAELETSAPYVLACGDIRSGAARCVAAAVADGERAAARVAELLG